MPNNTPIALYIGALTFLVGFGLTWRVWWLTLASLILAVILMIYRSNKGDPGYIIPAEKMEEMDRESKARMLSDDSHQVPHGGGFSGGTVTAYTALDRDASGSLTPPNDSRHL